MVPKRRPPDLQAGKICVVQIDLSGKCSIKEAH
jgi:hypothetical protein